MDRIKIIIANFNFVRPASNFNKNVFRKYAYLISNPLKVTFKDSGIYCTKISATAGSSSSETNRKFFPSGTISISETNEFLELVHNFNIFFLYLDSYLPTNIYKKNSAVHIPVIKEAAIKKSGVAMKKLQTRGKFFF